MSEHPNVARIRDGYPAFAGGTSRHSARSSPVVEFWGASTDPYAYDELIG